MDNPNDVIRMGATFNDVFAPDSLQVPWYITGGTPDWQGNISGAPPSPPARRGAVRARATAR